MLDSTQIALIIELLVLLININRKIRQQYIQLASIISSLHSLSTHNIQRYKWKLQKCKRHTQQQIQRQGPRNQGNLSAVDICEHTRLFEDTFLRLYINLKSSITLSCTRFPQHKTSTTLNPAFRLLLVLDYLHNGPGYKRFTERYNISKSQVCKEVKHLVPKIC